MVILNEIAKKLQDVLNGIGGDVPASYTPLFDFIVATEGFHLDKISDKQTHENFIPVFIGSLGGEYNPIPNLKEADYTIPVTLYFPVRFKNDIYALNEMLVDYFVGKMHDYGINSGKCLSNISVAQYGEIQNLDLDQFKTWVAQTYSKDVNITQPFMSMTFNLYLSTIGSNCLFGNSTSLVMSYDVYAPKTLKLTTNFPNIVYENTWEKEIYEGEYMWKWENPNSPTHYVLTYDMIPAVDDDAIWCDGQDFYEDTLSNVVYGTLSVSYFPVIFDNNSIMSSSEPNGEQLLGENESKGLPITTAYGNSFKLYYQATPDYRPILWTWLNGYAQTSSFRIQTIIDDLHFNRKVYLQSCNTIINKGEPITLTFSFSRKVS